MSKTETQNRTLADQLHALGRAMIRQARILKAAGDVDLAREMAERARALDLLGWSYVEPIPVRVRR